jgi:hypothetical protein
VKDDHECASGRSDLGSVGSACEGVISKRVGLEHGVPY